MRVCQANSDLRHVFRDTLRANSPEIFRTGDISLLIRTCEECRYWTPSSTKTIQDFYDEVMWAAIVGSFCEFRLRKLWVCGNFIARRLLYGYLDKFQLKSILGLLFEIQEWAPTLLRWQRSAWRSEIATHYVTRHNTPIHSILSTDPQLSISQKALGTLPEYGNVMPKHVGATIHD
jgi:hypothetical protein